MSTDPIKPNTRSDEELYNQFNSKNNTSRMAEKMIRVGLVKNHKNANYVLIFIEIIAILLTIFILKYFIL